MLPLLSEFWRLVQYLLSPENHSDGAHSQPQAAGALAGIAKTLLWASLAVLAGIGLGRLGG